MSRNGVLIWIIVSAAIWIMGSTWRSYDPENSLAFGMKYLGWLSGLLAIGYFSTPSGTLFGKVAFGIVIVMIVGILSKMLHLPGGNIIIIIALAGLFVAYAIRAFRQENSNQSNNHQG
jgi:hypothetical protein